MKINSNTLKPGFLKYREEYIKSITEVLDSGWYILGDNVLQFEETFSKMIGAKYCLGLNSGLDALILALRVLGIGNGDEVIVPANTYIATIIAITENGATPIFIEPNEFYNIDASLIERVITHKTRAIIPVHLYGQACDMEKILYIAQKYNLKIVEDCAQSHGSKFKHQVTGSFGDVGAFSFYPTKNLGAFGDAGAITTNNEEIYYAIKKMRNYGSEKKYYNDIIGINSRMDEIQAALLNVKLKYYGVLSLERNILATKYLNGISNSKIKLPQIDKKCGHVWHLFVIQVEDRERFIEYMKENEIELQIHYPIPPHLSHAYKYLGYGENDFPITLEMSRKVISLPIYDGMTDEEIDYIIEVINNFDK